MLIPMGYPDRTGERQILKRFAAENPLSTLQPVCSGEELKEMQEVCEQVYVDDAVADYLLDLVEATRKHANIALGVSPRGALSFLKAAKCYTALQGKNFLTPETVKYLAPYVLAHRILLEDTFSSKKKAADYIFEITNLVSVPTEDFDK
jgi:MoxR-like ATPase